MESRITRSRFIGVGVAGLLAGITSPAQAAVLQSGAAQDPDSVSIECLKNDDTQCAVDVWEEQFALEPYNDQTRQTLHLSLLAHAMRSLDKGILRSAEAAYTRARELVPTHQLYPYLQEALDLYERAIDVTLMTYGREFIEADQSDFEARYVDIVGVMGGQVKTFALTQKQPGYFNWYPTNESGYTSKGLAMRYQVFRMDSDGYVIAVFGGQGPNEFLYVELSWSSPSSVNWSINRVEPSQTTAITDIGYITINPTDWHTVEIRLKGNTFELWIDTILVGQEVILQYEPGQLGFGVGLNEYAVGTTYSAAFDDLVVYTLNI